MRCQWISARTVRLAVFAVGALYLAATVGRAAEAEGKPEKVLDKIVAGRLDKFYQEACLLEQPFVKDSEKTIKDVQTELIAKIGENIAIRRFTRFRLGGDEA